MSNEIRFDRRKGFVALPVEVLELDLSPGAFRLLVELCRMANSDGECWPSLEQLGDRLGRSRAAVSGYIRDLRDAELLSTTEQRTANGYNYRLRYRVVFWKDWRASLTGRVSGASEHPQAKRRIQPDERLSKTQNQNQKNQDQRRLSEEEKLIETWSQLSKGAPYPAFRHLPDTDLIEKTTCTISNTVDGQPVISTEIDNRLRALWTTLGLCFDATAHQKVLAHVVSMTPSDDDLEAILASIQRCWASHWRRIPDPQHVEKLLKTAGISTRAAHLKVLRGYLRRLKLSQKSHEKPLRNVVDCKTLPVTPVVASQVAPAPYVRGYN